LPEGAILDFYTVRNSNDPAERVEFEGRGQLIDAYSYLGKHYKQILFGLVNTDERAEAIKLLKQARDHGFMVVPAAGGGLLPGRVGTASVQQMKVIVIAPEFPHWNDPRPTAAATRSRNGTYYLTGGDYEALRQHPMDGNNHAWEGADPPHWFADSPGGTLSAGCPIGMAGTAGWSGSATATSNASHPRAGGETGTNSKPEMTLQNDWFNLVFNKANPMSLYNYYYQNSHGHISIEGDYSNIVGWVHDHHILDRAPYPFGTHYAVQPGTPLLRPQDPTGPMIVRASLYAEGVTFFFRQPVGSLGTVTVSVYQSQDIDSVTADTQTGTVSLILTGDRVQDPWDNRRWTVLNGGWEFVDQGDATKRIDYELVSGGSWSATAAGGTWNSSSTGYRGQGQGCGNLSNTTFGTNDVLGSADGNRLLSFCYYTHDHNFGGESAYQLSTLMRGSYTDPIAGTSEGSHVDRPWPYDHDTTDHNYPNSGNVFSGGPHSVGALRGDVYQTLADRGITTSGYNRIIFLFPDAEQSEGDPNASIIPHAGGSTATVPEGAGLTLLAHEVGHTFGTVDLYDKDFYANLGAYGPPPVPFFFECAAVGPYSVMAHGVRIDPWHKLRNLALGPWAQETPVTQDLGRTEIWQVETTLRDPVILKLPAHPLSVYASKNPTAPAGWTLGQGNWDNLANPNSWREYFLVENRNVNGGSYFGDQSPKGMYIWHIDERNIGGNQTAEETMTVIIEQADGRNELETNGSRTVGGGFSASPGDLQGDPFPGSLNVRKFDERPVALNNGFNSPTSWSHGAPDTGGSTILPGTPTDSFVRIENITGPATNDAGIPNAAGSPMSAYIYVEPAEAICTQPASLIAPGTQVEQGTEDFPVMLLNIENDGTYPNLSTKSLTIDTIKVYEVGTSRDAENIAVAKLYEDTNDNGALDVGTDTLLKTATVVDNQTSADFDHILFTNLGYVLNLNSDQDFIVAYDIAVDADTDPRITLGAELTKYDFVVPNQPGAVQMRQRLAATSLERAGYEFGAYRFPITANTATVIESSDTLTVKRNDDPDLAPGSVVQGEADVPMMQLALSVDQDQVTVNAIKVAQIGTSEGGVDLSVLRLWPDANGDGQIDDLTVPPLGEAAVMGPSGNGEANITGLSFTVTDAAPKYLILTATVTPSATLNATIQLAVEDASITVETNPLDPTSSHDVVVYELPIESGVTTVTQGNLPPYPVPGDPGDDTGPYYGDWLPTNNEQTDNPQPSMQFPRAGGDPNPPDPNATDTADTLSYVVQFSQDEFATAPFHEQTIAPSSSFTQVVNFQVSVPLAVGTWGWRVKAVDDEGAESDWSKTWFFEITQPPLPPQPPNAPTQLWPRGGQEVAEPNPVIYWVPSTDPDDVPEDLNYVIELDDNDDWTDGNLWEGAAAGTDLLSGQWVNVNVIPAQPLADNTQYYYRVKAIDPDNQESDWSATQNFWLNTQNDPPLAPDTGFSPSNGDIIWFSPVNVRCNHTVDPDPTDPTWPGGPYLSYVFQLQRDSAPTDTSYTYQYTVVANTPPSTDPFVSALVTGDLGADDPTHEHPWYWRVRAFDDEGAESPWSETQYFYYDTANQPPTLSPVNTYLQTLDPKYGNIVPPTHFEFEIVYADPEGDAPVDVTNGADTGAVWVEIDGDPNKRVPMGKLDETDNNYANGVTYVVGMNADNAALGIGGHTFRFYTASWSVQWPPVFDPSPTFPRWGLGPIIGTDSTLEFTDAAWDPTAIPLPGFPPDPILEKGYEEGVDVISVQLFDEDKADETQVTVTLATDPSRLFTDSEMLILTPAAGEPAGTFRGQMATLGRPEQPGDAESQLPIGDPGRVLNVMCGANGNVITVTYQDPDEGPDFPPSMTRDISVDSALVVDSTPPRFIDTNPILVVSSGANPYGNSDGLTIDVTWVDYVQPGPPSDQVDIAGYEVYLSATAQFTVEAGVGGGVTFNPAGSAILVRDLPAGATQYTISNNDAALGAAGITIQPGQTYYVAVVPYDEVPNRDLPANSVAVSTLDDQAPVLSNASPANGEVEVELGTPIAFSLSDPGTGIDESTLVVNVRRASSGSPADTGTWYPITGDSDWQMTASGIGTDRNYSFAYAPADPNAPDFFSLNQRVEVQVICDDNQGNRLDSWNPVVPFTRQFTYEMKADLTPPWVENQSPAPDAMNVLPSTPITFTVLDDIAGVDSATIQLLVNGNPIDAAAGLLIDATDPLAVKVSYPAPTADIVPWGQQTTVQVWATDKAGNAIPPGLPVVWQYETQADAVAPEVAIDTLIPAADETKVPITTPISFRLIDALSGISKDATGAYEVAVYIDVNNGGETQVPAAELNFSGTARSLKVDYQPLQPFNYNDQVKVRVVANDGAGNPLADEDPVIGADNGFEWRFTCAPPPTYRIAGTIVDQSGLPLPGVTVKVWPDGGDPANADIVKTNGNGTYIYELELGGDFTLMPELAEYTFDPVQRQVSVNGADVMNENFTGALRTYSVSGRVIENNVGLAGVTVSAGGDITPAVTDADGYYTITDVPSGRYTVTPTLANYTFRPGLRSVVVEGADSADVDFEGIADTYSISGTVRDFDGNRTKGVLISDGTRSTITNESGEFTLSDVPAGTATLRASKAGLKVVPATQDVTVPPNATGIAFTAYISFANSFPVGESVLNFIGVPCYPADDDALAVFGADATVWRWNPNGTPAAYVRAGVGGNQDVVDVQAGRGFFVQFDAGSVEIAGRPVSTGLPFTMALGPVWNMAANPFTNALPFANIKPAVAGSVRSYCYAYDAVSRGYVLISEVPGVNVGRTEIYPWEGIWLRTNGGSATANVDAPTGTTAAAAPQALELGAEGWTIPIVARAGGSTDATSAVGIAPALASPLAIENPPMAPQTVDVYLTGADGAYLAQDIRAAGAEGGAWTLTVVTDIPGAQVQLSLPDLSGVPNDKAVYLTDLGTGKRLYARTMPSYTFNAGPSGAKREFKLQVVPKDGAGLVITNAVASTSPIGTVVTYSVSKDCKVTAEVTNIAGRVVRTVCTGKDASQGVNSLSWDMTSASGTKAPSGRYIIRVTAVSEDGQQVSTVTSAMVRR